MGHFFGTLFWDTLYDLCQKLRVCSLESLLLVITLQEMNHLVYESFSIFFVNFASYHKLLYDQLMECMNDKLSQFLCGFRKQYSIQHALIRMLERWKHCLDESGVVMAVQ